MLSCGKMVKKVAIIGCIAVMTAGMEGRAVDYQSGGYLSAGVDESGTIVLLGEADQALSGNRTADGAFCDYGFCMDLLPEDGKIEGRRVSGIIPAGVNSLGQVVGQCVFEGEPVSYPFVREPDGRVWIFHTPSVTGQGEFTDISDTGYAVGIYEKSPAGETVGFLMNSHSRWIEDIRLPLNPCPLPRTYVHTQPNGINDDGEIVGNYDCTENPGDPADALFSGNGFYRAPEGTFYRVQFEDAVRTVAGKISNRGVIFGYYVKDDDLWVPFAAVKEDVIRPLVP
jgi:hypothetical protein